MSGKPVIPRAIARADIDQTIAFYTADAGPDVALRFIDALEKGLDRISAAPAQGSPHYGLALDLPGLRSRKLARFPYLLFYVERGDHIDLWRVLHASRDIPAWLAAE
ncbi:type II toxin-antitoxin system RelE/ParE family toxin [Allosphingosinicella indica]|uniref:Toxin ParE1/3/4 n=1 Tax=Allosphingosinicella indica TaxID=941907 RepID=A0A1X7GL82_9SPHN|nr:type II toxin-antitoxin system RelE/ParE family toxin [Allosphingosinicella indica]SMF71409.1 toxin ParE1/3/4 [Allosphingosinicella indica]